jgi:hypothetical protein
MKVIGISLATLAFLLVLPPLQAQEKQGAEPAAAQPIEFGTLKVKVVLAEYDGTKLISSLPYTVPVSMSMRGGRGSLRVGVRVPLDTSSKSGESSVTYLDVGTSLDCSLESNNGKALMDQNGGKYLLSISFERSSLYVPTRSAEGKLEGKEWQQGDPPPGTQPVIRNFRGNFTLTAREGQTWEMTVATDPVTGHVLKSEVSLTAVK